LEDRLRSRFEWGLITDIQPPELETRIAILRKKAAQDKLNAPDDVLEYIASKISTNIRELEGALIRVTAFASLNRQSVDLSLAEIVFKDELHAPLEYNKAYFVNLEDSHNEDGSENDGTHWTFLQLIKYPNGKIPNSEKNVLFK
jgi:hypothetical protein